jgi:hypothetical protein
MKLLAGFAVIVLFFVGCGEKKEEAPEPTKDLLVIDTTDIVTTPIENPNENFYIRYKFQPDKDYNYRLATITESEQTMRFDTTISSKVRQSVVYLINVKPVQFDKDSTFEIVCTFKSVKIDVDGNGEKISFHSDEEIDSTEREHFGEYITLIDNPFNLRVNKTGEILAAGQQVTPEQRNMVKDQIVEGGIRPLLMQVFRRIPEQTVAKDSLWTYPSRESQLVVFKLQNINKYSVAGLEKLNDDKIAVLDAGMETKFSGNPKFTEQGITYDFQKPVTENSGKIYFNITKGFITKSRTKNKVILSYTMEADTPGGKQKRYHSESMEYTNIVEIL